MKTELRILNQNGKEILQMRTAYVEIKNMGLFSFKEPTIKVIYSEWEDVPRVTE